MSSVLVIGAGVNELVAAHYLARAGRKVLLLASHADFSEAPAGTGWVPQRIVSDLGLERRGLEVRGDDPWVTASLPAGGRLELWRDMTKSVEAIRKLSPSDGAKWPGFCERMARLAHVLEKLYLQPPPDPTSRAFGDLAQLAGLGLAIRRLGRQGIEDLLRITPMSVADFLDEWFESDALKAVLGAAGIMHLCQGPRSGGTALRLLHHHVGSPSGVFRPPSSNIGRVLSALPGIEIRHRADAGRIVVREGRVTGVVLASGEEISAAIVVSGADPKRTLLGLVDPGWMGPDLGNTVRNIRCRGVAARITLALERPPGFSTVVVAPSLDYLEQAYDDAKHGSVSRSPYLEATSAGQTEDGRHRVEVLVQYAPYRPADGEWDRDRRTALGDRVAAILSEHVPGLAPAILQRTVLTPRDMEEAYGFPEGQEHHAELALDQMLWMRPVPALARYRTPIGGLYLCGPGTHPGGGIAGACGYNAAREILRDGTA